MKLHMRRSMWNGAQQMPNTRTSTTVGAEKGDWVPLQFGLLILTSPPIPQATHAHCPSGSFWKFACPGHTPFGEADHNPLGQAWTLEPSGPSLTISPWSLELGDSKVWTLSPTRGQCLLMGKQGEAEEWGPCSDSSRWRLRGQRKHKHLPLFALAPEPSQPQPPAL